MVANSKRKLPEVRKKISTKKRISNTDSKVLTQDEFNAVVEKMLASHKELAAKLTRIERRMEAANKANSTVYRHLSDNLGSIIKNQGVMYTKFLLTRLNFIELSEGRKISVSATEQMELENSASETPDRRITRLPKLMHAKPLNFEKRVLH